MLRKKRKIIAGVSTSRKLIDIGCGTGYFLNQMHSNGYTTKGVERSPEARRFCIDNFGLDVVSLNICLMIWFKKNLNWRQCGMY